ncbi:MAG: hypothetical protein Q4G35_00675 [Propionibacteriaceae bacterium]|nr:hypothetical protein [Propionibacteriaceae bacterium]
MNKDPRIILQEELAAWGIPLEPRGASFDVATISNWSYGNCANPVIVRLPKARTAKLMEARGVPWLARVISEELDTVSGTQLQEIVVRGGRLGIPTVQARRI